MRMRTPKAFNNLQPRVARASALPWVVGQKVRPNPEGVVERYLCKRSLISRTLSEFSGLNSLFSRGVALGWNLLTPLAFTRRHEQRIRQLC
jgi:hypothetical protein